MSDRTQLEVDAERKGLAVVLEGDATGRLEPEISPFEGDKANISLRGVRDLNRYYVVLETELKTVRLSEAEAWLIIDALNGIFIDTMSVPFLWSEIEDAIELDGLDCKWNVDGHSLVERLKGLTYSQALAVVDAVERFFDTIASEKASVGPELLRSLGLVR